MPIIGIRELSRQTSGVIDQLEESGEPVVITKQGRPVATLSAVSPDQVQDLTLSLAPSFAESRRRTDADLKAGRVRSLDEVSGELVREALESPTGSKVLAEGERSLAQRQSEIVDQVERLFSEAPSLLATKGTTFVSAWADSAQVLMEGAVNAARQSARRLEERVSAESKTGRRRSARAPKAARVKDGGRAPSKGGRRVKAAARTASARASGARRARATSKRARAG